MISAFLYEDFIKSLVESNFSFRIFDKVSSILFNYKI